jgi:dihydroxyacid dehydratase/phosphogluconate dehydratase
MMKLGGAADGAGRRFVLISFLPMDPKHRSHGITDGRDRAPARAMFKAIGFSDDDLRKPLIGVANTWIETMPCNFHLRRLSAEVKKGIRAAGGTPMEFNTIAISDGETMGTEGMRGEKGYPCRRWYTDGVQHDRHQRW